MHSIRSLSTLAISLLLLCHFVTSIAEADVRNGFSLPDVSDIPEQNSAPVARFILDRTELSPEYLQRRAILKSYTMAESLRGLKQREKQRQLLKLKGYSQRGGNSHAEPVISIPLTDIPKEYGYTAVISIGTYPSSPAFSSPTSSWSSLFNLLVDTGSDQVVVISAECTDAECLQVPHRYSCSASTTCVQDIKSPLTGASRWVQRYGDGTLANGTLVQDTLRFVSAASTDASSLDVSMLEVPNQSILVVDQPGLHLTKSYGTGVDGIIGLNLRSPAIAATIIQNLQKPELAVSVSSSSSPSPLESSRQSYRLSNSYAVGDSPFNGMGFMSLWLGKSFTPGEGGELLLNAVNRSRFHGPIRWSDRGPSPYDWSVPMDQGIQLHDAATDTTFFTVPETEHTYAVLDSGSDGIYLQRRMYHALYSQIPGAKQLENGFWRVPCRGTTDLVFGIGGALYRIPYEDWVKKPNATLTRASSGGPGMCQGKVYGSSPGPTLLGAAFMRTVYTIFDFSRPGNERMGFAALA